MTKKGLFVVEEFNSFSKTSGAYIHTITGYRELSNYFKLVWYGGVRVNDSVQQNSKKKYFLGKRNTITKKLSKTGATSFIKDIILILKQLGSIYHKLQYLKENGIEFVYERSKYLHFGWLIACKIIGLPHFYEVNGILFLDKQKYQKNIFPRLAEFIEKYSYKQTSMGFFIGGINEELGIHTSNAVIVQNGIEKSILDKQKLVKKKKVNNDLLRVVFLGHIMKHHRLDLLLSSFDLLDHPNLYELHIIGRENPNISLHVPPNINVYFHGAISNNELPQELLKYDVGIIAHGLDYFSNMKVYTYAASKLILCIPDVKNFRRVFSSDEAVFFQQSGPAAIAKCLVRIRQMKWEEKQSLIERAFRKVYSDYSWDKIYARKARIMKQTIIAYEKAKNNN